MQWKRKVRWQCVVLIASMTLHHGVFGDESRRLEEEFRKFCVPEALQAAADKSGIALSVGEITNIISGEKIPLGAKFVEASNELPAYCKVSGSFVTNPKTGKTANFLANLPLDWNSKYLQYGCFGTCGFFSFNDASSPLVHVVAQGMPGDSLRKGYASFSTDEGHQSREHVAWAEKGPGEVDREALDDYLYQATAALAPTAKKFIEAFYGDVRGTSRNIENSYFVGCSGGGRNAMAAASHYPDEFDGYIAGSPAIDLVGMAFHSAAFALATKRPGFSHLSPAQVTLLNDVINGRCDGLDGVKDGLIQNPAVCDFTPEKHLPRCEGNTAGDGCFTRPQVEALSVLLTAVVDEKGKQVYPGISVSNLGLVQSKLAIEADRAEGMLRVMMLGNPADFSLDSLIRLTPGADEISLQAVVDSTKVAEARESMGKGVVDMPEQLGSLEGKDHKIMIWHDLSDNTLTPYESINYYNELARLQGGYEKLQDNVKLFLLPGTGHCSGGVVGVGPNSFDALTALERWVESGEAPNALVATHYPGTDFGRDVSQAPGRTMPLCAFPQKARYAGEGDINNVANWHCAVGDESMFEVGPSGRRAGLAK